MSLGINSIAAGKIDTAYGPFRLEAFSFGGAETIVLHTEDIPGTVDNVLCRIQSECIGHMFSDDACDCSEQIASSLQQINRAKSGLLIYLRQEGMGLGIAGKITSRMTDCRAYFAASEILTHYGIHSVSLISTNKRKILALETAGINVRSHCWHQGKTVLLGSRIRRVVDQVQRGEAHRPIVGDPGKPTVLVLGDLNVDRARVTREPTVAGTGYNCAFYLQKALFMPIIFGKVGRDEYGRLIRHSIEENQLHSLLGIHSGKATGSVDIEATGQASNPFHYVWDKTNNANDYDCENLWQAIQLIGPCEYSFVSSYLFVQKQFQTSAIHQFLKAVHDTRTKLILDLVRRSLAHDVLREFDLNSFSKAALKACLKDLQIYCIVGDMNTFERLGFGSGKSRPDRVVFRELKCNGPQSFLP